MSSSKSSVTAITVNQINQIGQKTAGWKPLSPSATDKTFEKALKEALTTQWPNVFPHKTLPAGQTAFGYCGPYSKAEAHELPPSVVNQIKQDFKNWEIPVDTKVATQIAQTIVTDLVATGGQAILSDGKTASGPNVEIYWLVLAGLGNTTDVVYTFAGISVVDIG